jgi:hypothetical protein
MPTIEVGEFDKVFVVRRQAMELPESFRQVVDVGENDLLLWVQEGRTITTEDGREIRGRPITKVMIDGGQVACLGKVRVEADSNGSLVMEFSVLSPDAEGVETHDGFKESLMGHLGKLKRLLPFATIHETGVGGVVIRTLGQDLPKKEEPPTQP